MDGNQSLRTEEDSVSNRPVDQVHSFTSSRSSHVPPSQGTIGTSTSWNSNSTDIGGYDKLSRGDVGYGGNAFTGSPDGKQVAESLLAKRLRDLGVGVPSRQDPFDGV